MSNQDKEPVDDFGDSFAEATKVVTGDGAGTGTDTKTGAGDTGAADGGGAAGAAGASGTEGKAGDGAGTDDGGKQNEQSTDDEQKQRLADLEKRGKELEQKLGEGGGQGDAAGTEDKPEPKLEKQEPGAGADDGGKKGDETPAAAFVFPTEFKASDGKTYKTAEVIADLEPDQAGLLQVMIEAIQTMPAYAKAPAGKPGFTAEAAQELVTKAVGEAHAEYEKKLAGIEAEIAANDFVREVAELGDHSDAFVILRTKKGSEPFWGWVDKQGKFVQLMAHKGDAQDMADVIAAYKEDLARARNKNLDAERGQERSRRRDITRSTGGRDQTTGRYTKGGAGNPEEEFADGFREAAQMEKGR
ncbi:MAG: hypothetical protein ABFD89_06985 [Bryobacteraceae bacterium]